MYSTRKILSICGAVAAGSALGLSCIKRLQQETHSPAGVSCTSNTADGISDKPVSLGCEPVVLWTHSPRSCNPDVTAQCTTAINRSRKLVQRVMIEQGIPGAVVAVSKNGELVWSEGIGYSDVENEVQCTPETVMRIASISKPLTAVALLQLWEKGLVDLDSPIQNYVPKFPKKKYDGKEVKTTTRQLLSHLGGIRHYEKKKLNKELNDNKVTIGERKEKGAFDHKVSYKEYYITKHFETLEESMELFAEDELLSEPGTKFNYTTHGWTIVSAVIEKTSGTDYLSYMKKHVFNPVGMTATGGEFHEPLVFNRSRHYVRSDSGTLSNTPYVDLSYKWAGGGLISNAEDLMKLGNALLTSYQLNTKQKTPSHNCNKPCSVSTHQQTENSVSGSSELEEKSPNCILEPATVTMMWTPVVYPNERDSLLSYGMGWYLTEHGAGEVVGGKKRPFSAAHTGSAIGASSVLVVMSDSDASAGSLEWKSSNFDTVKQSKQKRGRGAQGVVVAAIFNLQEVNNVYQLGVKIAEKFLQ